MMTQVETSAAAQSAARASQASGQESGQVSRSSDGSDGGSGGAQGGAAISADFETFLRMLTTQITNQDPLDPMDSADFAVQLATFSGVEQQVKTNQLLEGLAARMGTSDMVGMANWIGQEVRAPGPGYFDGDPVRLSLPRNAAADQAVLVIRDAAGAEIGRQPLPLGLEEAMWSGLDGSGDTAEEGSYSFEVEHFAQGELLGVTGAQPYTQVVEARGGTDGLMLVLEGGAVIPAAEVTALRAAS